MIKCVILTLFFSINEINISVSNRYILVENVHFDSEMPNTTTLIDLETNMQYTFSDGEFYFKRSLSEIERFTIVSKDEILEERFAIMNETIDGYQMKSRELLINADLDFLDTESPKLTMVKREIYAKIPEIDEMLSDRNKMYLPIIFKQSEPDSFNYFIGLESVDVESGNVRKLMTCSRIEVCELNVETFEKWKRE